MSSRRFLRHQHRSHTTARHVALPLGGIGTGNVALAADGSLRQWQLHNIGNHVGTLPHSFFALRTSCVEPPLDVLRILQAPPAGASEPTPLTNDDHVPDWQRDLLAEVGGVAETRFDATYPFGRVQYVDPDLPLDVSLEAFTPLVPFDVERSSIPAALFTFTLRNTSADPVHGTLAATLQNAVGWDGVAPIEGVASAGYGGNTNRLVREPGWTSLVLENNSLAPDAPGAGQLVLAAGTELATGLAQWTRPEEFLAYLRSRGEADLAGGAILQGADWRRTGPASATGPSPAGQTWNGGLGVPFGLAPGEEQTIRFVIAWTFPNRYLNFDQFGPAHPERERSRFWLGNAYTTRFTDAQHVARTVAADWDALHRDTASWTSVLVESSLDDTAVEHLAAQLAYVRSPSCFQTADGRFYGFEGVLGASTSMWNGAYGGSCPLNCTHVWNYAQAIAAVFPSLERDMRETEYDVMQAPEGYLPHRVIVPTYLPQLWDVAIGGPEAPALDGMLGAVLKTYREYRHGAGLDWLRGYWGNVVRLIDHVEATWDPDDTGVLRGEQPSTHDINLRGANPFMGGLWLAALRAAEEMARLLDDGDRVRHYRQRFEHSSRRYDELLFNGDYYVQVLGPDEPADHQWGDGCLADQLFGQWWAHQLDLGHVLPAEHVRSALRAIVRNNLRHGFRDLDHGFRVFADGDDDGLVLCSWPGGGRPDVPVRYADEVWTGVEAQLAAHCFREGLEVEGRQVLDALWSRYDGRRRNPYNEIECGDHYVRAMAGWSVLEAMTGYQYDAGTGVLRLAAEPGQAVPFLTDRAWGLLRLQDDAISITCHGGRLVLDGLEVSRASGPRLTFTERLDLGADQTWRVEVSSPSTPRAPVAAPVPLERS